MELQLLSLLLKVFLFFLFDPPWSPTWRFCQDSLKFAKKPSLLAADCILMSAELLWHQRTHQVSLFTVWLFKDHSAEINVCTYETQANLITSYFVVTFEPSADASLYFCRVSLNSPFLLIIWRSHKRLACNAEDLIVEQMELGSEMP